MNWLCTSVTPSAIGRLFHLSSNGAGKNLVFINDSFKQLISSPQLLSVRSCKVLGLLSNWGKPLFFSCLSCNIPGNRKFPCGATKPTHAHVSLVLGSRARWALLQHALKHCAFGSLEMRLMEAFPVSGQLAVSVLYTELTAKHLINVFPAQF